MSGLYCIQFSPNNQISDMFHNETLDSVSSLYIVPEFKITFTQ